MTGRRGAFALVAVLALAAALRVNAALGRELWNDDVGRLRLALLSWDAIAERLPYLDNLKSPYLIGLHKLWAEVVGSGSLLAIRGYSIAWGLVTIVLVHRLVRSIAGPRAALLAALWFAVNPYFVRWSVEVHQYAPAAAALLGAALLVFGREELRRGHLVALGLLGGLGVAIFPGTAPAFTALLLAPSVRRSRDVRGFVVAACAAAFVAAPAALSMARSVEAFRPALDAGRMWAPYFSLRRTPFEVAARFAGVELRQGSGGLGLALAVTAALAAVLLLCLRRDERRPLRIALFVAGAVPLAVLAAASSRGIGVCNDRYAFAACALLPIAVVAAIAPSPPGAPGVVARGLGCVLAAVTAFGTVQMLGAGAAFPRDLTSRSYECAALVDAEAAASERPDVLFVHGDVPFSQVWLRSGVARRDGVAAFHLTTRAWSDVLAAKRVTETSVPPSAGWPFNDEELAGPGVTACRDDALRALAEGRRAWLVLENPRIVRTLHLEEEEVEHGLHDAYLALDGPRSAERDAAVLDALRRYLALADGVKLEARFGERAVLVSVAAR